MATRIAIEGAQLFGRECDVEVVIGNRTAAVTVRMDDFVFTSEYALDKAQAAVVAQAHIALVTRADLQPLLAHVRSVENGGRVRERALMSSETVGDPIALDRCECGEWLGPGDVLCENCGRLAPS